MAPNDIEAGTTVYYDDKKDAGGMSGHLEWGKLTEATVELEETKDVHGSEMVEPGLHRGLKDRHSESPPNLRTLTCSPDDRARRTSILLCTDGGTNNRVSLAQHSSSGQRPLSLMVVP